VRRRRDRRDRRHLAAAASPPVTGRAATAPPTSTSMTKVGASEASCLGRFSQDCRGYEVGPPWRPGWLPPAAGCLRIRWFSARADRCDAEPERCSRPSRSGETSSNRRPAHALAVDRAGGQVCGSDPAGRRIPEVGQDAALIAHCTCAWATGINARPAMQAGRFASGATRYPRARCCPRWVGCP
jgi:hypothetical protein